jgi:hypothetical protein
MNAAFGTSIDCFYCGKSLVKVKLHAFDKAEPKYHSSQMGCCKKETIACSTDQAILQAPTTLPVLSFKEYINGQPVSPALNFFNSPLVKHINEYSFKRNAPPRDILSLIHVLRI